MNARTIKLKFETTIKKESLLFDEYEDKIINSIETNDRLKFDVFIKNPMPITEFESIAKELCDKIMSKFNCKTESFHNDECALHGNNTLISSITFYIEITFCELSK